MKQWKNFTRENCKFGKMMEKIKEKVNNECDKMKSKIESDLLDSVNFMEQAMNDNIDAGNEGTRNQ